MDLDKAIKERHSVRKFSTKSVDWKDILEAIDLARLAPLAGNIQTLKFVIVNDKKKMDELADACQQNFVDQAQYILVLCSDPTQVTRNYGDRAEMYCRQQAGAAIENFLLKITELGLASCWVGAFSETSVKNILKIPDNINVEAILPVGYEMPPKGKQRIKPDLHNTVYFNKWKEKRAEPWKKPEAV